MLRLPPRGVLRPFGYLDAERFTLVNCMSRISGRTYSAAGAMARWVARVIKLPECRKSDCLSSEPKSMGMRRSYRCVEVT
jgi:hypothetical protein